jgi:hypothetical protein
MNITDDKTSVTAKTLIMRANQTIVDNNACLELAQRLNISNKLLSEFSEFMASLVSADTKK